MKQANKNVALEVCVDSLASAVAAARHGAARVEINSALELGGLTGSIGLTEQVVQQVKPMGCAVIAMVRPRPGGFAYGTQELAVMRRDIASLIDAGVDGVALGVLKPTGVIDAQATGELIEPVLAQGRQAVFHRAFDLTPDPSDALETLVELGITRVLTSGQCPTALDGAPTIRKLIEQAAGRIEVLPGSGINAKNVQALIEKTGCDQVHASLSGVVQDASGSCRPAITFSSPPPEHLGYRQADEGKIIAVMDALCGKG